MNYVEQPSLFVDDPAPVQDARLLVTIDDMLPELQRQEVFNFLRGGGWRFGWKSSRKTDAYSFWHLHFAGHRNAGEQTPYPCADELQKNAPLIFKVWSGLADTVFRGHTLMRCYANAHAYGGDGTLHTDSTDPDSRTAVYYPHGVWWPNWAGETVVFNADKSDIIAAVYPRPNRMVVFPGYLPHVARGVSRTCPELRIVLVFKTEVGHDPG